MLSCGGREERNKRQSHPLKAAFIEAKHSFNIVISVVLFGHRISSTVFLVMLTPYYYPKVPGLVW